MIIFLRNSKKIDIIWGTVSIGQFFISTPEWALSFSISKIAWVESIETVWFGVAFSTCKVKFYPTFLAGRSGVYIIYLWLKARLALAVELEVGDSKGSTSTDSLTILLTPICKAIKAVDTVLLIQMLGYFEASEAVSTWGHAIIGALLAVGVAFYTSCCISQVETIGAGLTVVCEAEVRVAFGAGCCRGWVKSAIIAVLNARVLYKD